MAKTRVVILTLLIGVAATIAFLSYSKNMTQWWNASHRIQNAQRLRLEIPDAHWEPRFFEYIEKGTKEVGLPSLRTEVLPDQDLEVRFWYSRVGEISGLILRRSGENWSAIFLRPIHNQQSLSWKVERLGPPKSGWEVVWTRLVSEGILTLPDGDSKETCKTEVVDGISFIVETNFNREYRTYRYGNPQYAKCDEAKKVLSIEAFIIEEFDLVRFWKL
jgi:hypothetical protein